MSDLSRDGTYTDLQPLAVPVQVQRGELKCLAYRDREGEWRDYNTGWLLAGPIQVVEYNFELAAATFPAFSGVPLRRNFFAAIYHW